MEGTKNPSHLLDVEKQAYHASRPGFRIAEIIITPTQKVISRGGSNEFRPNRGSTFVVARLRIGGSQHQRRK